MAEEGYYTWIDAEGRIQNTPVPEQKKSPESPPGDKESYLSEEQVQRKIEKYDQDNPAFYIWTDAQGNTFTQTIDVDAEQEAAEQAASVDKDVMSGWDHALAPPFRVSQEITDGPCCANYADQFGSKIKPFKSLQMFDPIRNRRFPAQGGQRYAWYFNIGSADVSKSTNANTANSAEFAIPEVLPRIMILRTRGGSPAMSLIGLNSKMKPLYHVDSISFLEQPETWSSLAYRESVFLIEDPEVAYFIVYPDMNPAEALSLEVRWASGVSPF